MHAAPLPPVDHAMGFARVPGGQGISRRRVVSIALTIAIHLLLLLMLIRLAPRLNAPPQASETTSVTLLPDKGSAPAAAKVPAARKPKASGGAHAPVRTPAKAPTPTPPVPTNAPQPLKMMVLSRNEFHSADIGALPRAAGGGEGAAAGAGSGDTSGDTPGAGTGPGGEKLYNAEWYREPTQAELATYLPRQPVSGWGEIACRTVAGFRVEDCKEIGNEPMGSGLARAVREAAWQFRVRAPRIGGRTMVGTWVRIHIDFMEGKARS